MENIGNESWIQSKKKRRGEEEEKLMQRVIGKNNLKLLNKF